MVYALPKDCEQSSPLYLPHLDEMGESRESVESVGGDFELPKVNAYSSKVDYDEKRALEIESILGNPLRTAQALSVSVPAMTMLYQQLSFINKRLVS